VITAVAFCVFAAGATVGLLGITYVHLDTGEGVLALPNSQVLAAAVGPLPAEVPSRPGWPA
jgi:hypothetical protein